VKEQMDNEKSGKQQARVIMHSHPLVFCDPQEQYPAALVAKYSSIKKALQANI
jgi:hypothetical protein